MLHRFLQPEIAGSDRPGDQNRICFRQIDPQADQIPTFCHCGSQAPIKRRADPSDSRPPVEC